MCHKRDIENYVRWVAKAKTNLDCYLESLEIKHFQGLKDLIISGKFKDTLTSTITGFARY